MFQLRELTVVSVKPPKVELNPQVLILPGPKIVFASGIAFKTETCLRMQLLKIRKVFSRDHQIESSEQY